MTRTIPHKPGKTGQQIFKELLDKIPKDIKLSWKQAGQILIVKPDGYLGSDNFTLLHNAIRDLGGDYISQGPLSHFAIILTDPMTAIEQFYKGQANPLPIPTFTVTIKCETPKQFDNYLKILKQHVVSTE